MPREWDVKVTVVCATWRYKMDELPHSLVTPTPQGCHPNQGVMPEKSPFNKEIFLKKPLMCNAMSE